MACVPGRPGDTKQDGRYDVMQQEDEGVLPPGIQEKGRVHGVQVKRCLSGINGIDAAGNGGLDPVFCGLAREKKRTGMDQAVLGDGFGSMNKGTADRMGKWSALDVPVQTDAGLRR